jgi:hypothetical protein
LRSSLIWPSFIFLLALITLLYFLILKITHSRISSILVPFLFFFNGSIFSWQYFWQDFRASSLSLLSFLGKMTKEYGHLADYKIHFSNIIADYILPQRAIILGLLVGVAAVYFLWSYWESKNKKKLLFAGLLIGVLPIIHTHTFMSLVFVAGFLALIELAQNFKNFKKVILNWIWFVLPVLVLALPQVFWLYPSASENFMKFGFGWMKGDQNVFWFWIRNLGLYLPAMIIGYIFTRSKLRTFYLAFLGLFFISNIIIFQPHLYDNMKIMLWWFLLSVVLIADWLGRLQKKMGKPGYLAVALIFCVLIPTGFLSVYRESYVSWRMFSNEDLNLAEFVTKNISQEAIFLTSDKHNGVIPCLTGRRILMGYRGWLWTHGINYRQREADIMKMYEGSDQSLNLIEKYGVNYVLVEQDKISDFHINQGFFISNPENFSLVYQSLNYLVFRVNK